MRLYITGGTGLVGSNIIRTVASGEKTYSALGRRTCNVVDGLREFRGEWEAFHAERS